MRGKTPFLLSMPPAKPPPRKQTERPKERLHGSIARKLGVAIVSGRIKPGETLDNEIDSSERMAVSRTAYREAVRILAAKGLVASRPKSGTQVCPRSAWHLLDPEVLSWLFESQPSQDFVVGLFELRLIIEPAAAALAAERRSADDLARMRDALQRMERHGLANADGQSADREFHDAILAATRNPALRRLVQQHRRRRPLDDDLQATQTSIAARSDARALACLRRDSRRRCRCGAHRDAGPRGTRARGHQALDEVTRQALGRR